MNNKLYVIVVVFLNLIVLYSCEVNQNDNLSGEVKPPIGIWKKYSSVKGTVRDLAVYNDAILAATDSGVYVSNDGAKTWANSFPSIATTICVVSNTLIILGTVNGLYKSTDGGHIWMFVNNLPAEEVSFISHDYDGNLWVGFYFSGTYFSNNLGSSWTSKNAFAGPMVDQPYSFEALPSKMLFLGCGNSMYSKKSTDTTWTDLYVNGGSVDFAETRPIKYIQDSLMLICTWHVGNLHYTTNLGRSWQRAIIDGNLFHPVAITDFLALDTIFIASGLGDGIFISRNSGANWITVSDSLDTNDKDIWSLLNVGDYAIAGSSNGTIYRNRFR